MKHILKITIILVVVTAMTFGVGAYAEFFEPSSQEGGVSTEVSPIPPPVKIKKIPPAPDFSGIFTDLGSLRQSKPYTDPFALNDSGQIVGMTMVDNEVHPFLWEKGTMKDLGLLEKGDNGMAFSINNRGQIVGFSSLQRGDSAQVRAFLWEKGKMKRLLNPSDDRTGSSANSINDQGQIAGTLYNYQEAGSNKNFLWERGKIIEITDNYNSRSLSNNRNQSIGTRFLDDEQKVSRAVLFGNGVEKDLHPTGMESSSAAALNNLGQVVVFAEKEERTVLYFWEKGVFTEIGNPAEVYDSTHELRVESGFPYVIDLNDKGQLLGGSPAFVWQKGRFTFLQDLLPKNTDWYIWHVNGINNSGQIIGHRNKLNSPGRHGFLLKLLPPRKSKK